MIEKLKFKLARFLLKRKLKSKKTSEIKFGELLKKSKSFFVIMPEDDTDFNNSFLILNYLKSENKVLEIFTNDYRLNLLQSKFSFRIYPLKFEDKTKLNLISKKTIDFLSSKYADVVIDLNRGNNLFCSYAANIVKSDVKIGFDKIDSEIYYNLIIKSSGADSKSAYEALINSLQMF